MLHFCVYALYTMFIYYKISARYPVSQSSTGRTCQENKTLLYKTVMVNVALNLKTRLYRLTFWLTLSKIEIFSFQKLKKSIDFHRHFSQRKPIKNCKPLFFSIFHLTTH